MRWSLNGGALNTESGKQKMKGRLIFNRPKQGEITFSLRLEIIFQPD